MSLLSIQQEIQAENPDWEIDVRLADPNSMDPMNIEPIIIYARRREDGQLYASPSYERPQLRADSLARWMAEDLNPARQPGSTPSRWSVLN